MPLFLYILQMECKGPSSLVDPLITPSEVFSGQIKIVWDLQKKKIKRKHQLVRPTPAELEKLKIDIEDDQEEQENNNAEEDKTDPGLSSEIVEKLFKEAEGTNQGVSAFCFVGKTIFTGYEDGLISMFNLRVIYLKSIK